MKRIWKQLCCIFLLTTTLSLGATAKSVATRVYMFGFAASFNDSVVHFTDIQQVDSAWTEPKTKFLRRRENYSNQLYEYLAGQQNMPHRTCMVIYNTDRSKLEKKYQKMKRLYTEKAKDKYDVRYLTVDAFRFEAVDGSEEVEQEQPQTKKELKKAKKEQKKAQKEQKKAQKEQKKAKKDQERAHARH